VHQKTAERLLSRLNILVVDGNSYMRLLTSTMLINLRAQSVFEAADGLAALEAIRNSDSDIMVIDWDMPILDGSEVMRLVRSPGVFPRPNMPIIMLTNRLQHSSVMEAMRNGVHEFLLNSTSPKALRDRLMSIVGRPRKMVKLANYYVPEARRVPSAREIARTSYPASRLCRDRTGRDPVFLCALCAGPVGNRLGQRW
jgi:two-component system chemotaxis response regulator CheY